MAMASAGRGLGQAPIGICLPRRPAPRVAGLWHWGASGTAASSPDSARQGAGGPCPGTGRAGEQERAPRNPCGARARAETEGAGPGARQGPGAAGTRAAPPGSPAAAAAAPAPSAVSSSVRLPARNQTPLRAPGVAGSREQPRGPGHFLSPLPSAGTEGAHRGQPPGGARGEKRPRAPRAPAQRTVSAPRGLWGPWPRVPSRPPPPRVPDGAARGAQGRRLERAQPAPAAQEAESDMLPRGRNGTEHPAPFGRRPPAPGGALAGAQGAAPPGPAQVLTAGLLTLLIVWTLLGNALVCAAVVRSRHLRARMTHVFIVSLAVSDLLVALLVMPWKAVAEVAGRWPFGAFCDVWVAFDIMCSTASILNLCVISVDRYWAISSPFRYQRRMTRRVALVMVGLAWTLSVLVSFIPIQLHWHRDQAAPRAAPDLANGTSGGQAGDPGARGENCDSSLNRTYAIASSLVSFYIPVAIMLATYARIYRIAHAQIGRIACLERAGRRARRGGGAGGLRASIQKETKVLKTLSVIMGVFVCCWLPFFLLNCMAPFCSRRPDGARAGFPCVSDTTFDVFVWFGWANSSLNPVIYAFNADFRKVFARLLGCGRLCAPRPRVATVTGSNELTSYDRDTVFSGEAAAAACGHVVPGQVTPRHREGDKEDEEEGPLSHVCRISQAQGSPEGDPAAQSVWELDCEGETSLGKATPFTSSGFH